MGASLITKIEQLITYLLRVVEFPKKPEMFSSKILNVYSNIIANSDCNKINDLVVDIILKEENFF